MVLVCELLITARLQAFKRLFLVVHSLDVIGHCARRDKSCSAVAQLASQLWRTMR